MTWVAQNAAEYDALVQQLSGLSQRFGLRLLSLSLPPGAWVVRLEGERLGELYASLQLPLTLGPSQSSTAGSALRILMPPIAPIAPIAPMLPRSSPSPVPAASSVPAALPVPSALPISPASPLSPLSPVPSAPPVPALASFRAADLRGRDFSGADLRGADFSAADLRGANFTGANLAGASFAGASFGATEPAAGMNRLRRTVLQQGRAVVARRLVLPLVLLFGLMIASSLLPSAFNGVAYGAQALLLLPLCLLVLALLWLLQTLHGGATRWLAAGGSRFVRANLFGADFSGATFGLTDFAGADLRHCTWRGADCVAPLYLDRGPLRDARIWSLLTTGRGAQRDFAGLDLSWQDLSGLDLSDCNFQNCNLQQANLAGCNLQRAQLQGANCRVANLQQADLSGADLSLWQIDSATLHQGLRCADWRAGDLPGGRWPPLPYQLRPDELMQHLAPLPAGVVFLAASLAELWRWLTALEAQAGVRHVQQIRIRYGDEPVNLAASVPNNGLTDVPTNVPTADTAFEIDVLLEPGADASFLCQRAWQAQQRLAKQGGAQQGQQGQTTDPLPDARLVALFQALLVQPKPALA